LKHRHPNSVTRLFLEFEDERYARHEVTHEWVKEKHAEAGGYYVMYKDGYSAFSPAEAFEEGYTFIDENFPKDEV